MRKSLFADENGMSLVEVVASLLIISIILVSFFSLFVQSKKTNTSAEVTNDATYYAQTEMERIYGLSKNHPFSPSTLAQELPKSSYSLIPNQLNPNCTSDHLSYKNQISFENPDVGNYKSVITFKELCDFKNSTVVTVEILDANDNKKAMLENVYVWQ